MDLPMIRKIILGLAILIGLVGGGLLAFGLSYDKGLVGEGNKNVDKPVFRDVTDTERGVCIDERDMLQEEGIWKVIVTPCDQDHTGEVFYQGTLGPDKYPGKPQAKKAAEALCDEGRKINAKFFNRNAKDLRFNVLVPTELDWAANPNVHCVVGLKDKPVHQEKLVK